MNAVLNWGSEGVDEEAFVESFERCQYPNDRFKHADHVRLAWIYIRRHGVDEAEQRIAQSIRAFAGSLGHGEKYHETMTVAWLRLVYSAHCATPKIEDFREFISLHRWLADKRSLNTFYSQRLLETAQARRFYVDPDLRSLPGGAWATTTVPPDETSGESDR